MTNKLRYVVMCGMLSLLFLEVGCDDEQAHSETIAIHSELVTEIPYMIEGIYSCNHTNYSGRDHIHPKRCGKKKCPRLNPDGSIPEKKPRLKTTRHPDGRVETIELPEETANLNTMCPDESGGGVGIKLDFETLSNSVNSTLRSIKKDALTQFGTEADNTIESSGEVSTKLNRAAKGTLKAGVKRDLSAAFKKKWAEDSERSFKSSMEAANSQAISIGFTAWSDFSCGQKYDVDLALTIKITTSLEATATVEGTIDEDGNWTKKSIEWNGFNVSVWIGVKGKAFTNRYQTSCNCSPGENHEGTEEEAKHGKRLPRHRIVPLEKSPFSTKRTVLVKSENLDEFEVSVPVLKVERSDKGAIENMTVLLPMAGAGGFALIKIQADLNGRGSHAATGLNMLKSPDKDTIAYEVPQPGDGTRTFEGLDRDGNLVRREAHKLGTLNGKEIVMLDNSDRKFDRVDRLTGNGEDHELSTVSVELMVQGELRVGNILKGTFNVEASPAAARKYRFDVIIYAPGFQPPMTLVEDPKPNVRLRLEDQNIFATKPGSDKISLELRPTKR